MFVIVSSIAEPSASHSRLAVRLSLIEKASCSGVHLARAGCRAANAPFPFATES